ncbi:MAG TPA: hypothetical protein VFV70_04645 [Hyphomonadaceae bacterium]|nr:hypothetical protein [Hyphomonadaceae bacterium]
MSEPKDASTSKDLIESAAVPTHHRDNNVIEHEPLPADLQAVREQRSLKDKLFGIGFSGWFQLVVTSVVVGAIFQAGGVDFFSPTFAWERLPGGILNGAIAVLGWAIEIGWRPLITGALVVGPIWLAWRLLSVPFRH